MPLAVDGLTLPQLVAAGGDLVDKINAAVDGYYAWSIGTAIGGPGGDGRYPLPLPGGPALVPTPAKLEAIAYTAIGQDLNLLMTPAGEGEFLDGRIKVFLANGTQAYVFGVQKIAERKATEATRNHADLWQKFDLQMMGVTARLAAGAAPLFADFTASRQRYRRDGAAITLAQAATGDRTGEAYYPLNVPVTVFASGDRRQTADGLAVERGTANLIPDPTFAGAAIGADDAGGALPTGWGAVGTSRWEVQQLAVVEGVKRIRLRLWRVGAGPAVRVSGAGGLTIPALARGGVAHSAMFGFQSKSADIVGVQASMRELTAGGAQVGAATVQFDQVDATEGAAMSRKTIWRAALAAGNKLDVSYNGFISGVATVDPLATYEIVFDLTMPQLEDAASADDITTFTASTRGDETVTLAPARLSDTVDMLVGGPTATQWRLGVANPEAGIVVAPIPGSGAVKRVVVFEPGQFRDPRVRALVNDVVNPVEWQTITTRRWADSLGREWTNENPLDSAYRMQVARNRKDMVRFEVREGDLGIYDNPANTILDRSEMNGGEKDSQFLAFRTLYHARMWLYLEPGQMVLPGPQAGATGDWNFPMQVHQSGDRPLGDLAASVADPAGDVVGYLTAGLAAGAQTMTIGPDLTGRLQTTAAFYIVGLNNAQGEPYLFSVTGNPAPPSGGGWVADGGQVTFNFAGQAGITAGLPAAVPINAEVRFFSDRGDVAPFVMSLDDADVMLFRGGYQSKARTPAPGFTGKQLIFWRGAGPIERGVWHHFVFQLRCDWRTAAQGGVGRAYVWWNGRQIVDYDGPIGGQDALGHYFKRGLYRARRPYPMAARTTGFDYGTESMADFIAHPPEIV